MRGLNDPLARTKIQVIVEKSIKIFKDKNKDIPQVFELAKDVHTLLKVFGDYVYEESLLNSPAERLRRVKAFETFVSECLVSAEKFIMDPIHFQDPLIEWLGDCLKKNIDREISGFVGDNRQGRARVERAVERFRQEVMSRSNKSSSQSQ